MLYQTKKGVKSISVLIVLSLLLGLLLPAVAMGAGGGVSGQATGQQSATQFPDLADSYASEEIQALAEAGILSGYGDGSFAPQKAMTRAELAKILVLAMGLNVNEGAAAPFTDVASDSWYKGYVGALVQSGITRGTSDSTFSPEAKVTREELAVFFIRAFGLEETALALEADASLSDFNKISDWARKHVSLAFKTGFIQGISNGDGTFAFAPRDNAERQALARLAYEFAFNKDEFTAKAEEIKTAEGEGSAVQEGQQEIIRSSGSRRNRGGGSSSIEVINNEGTHRGNYTIASSGTYGPAAGTSTITGTLTVNPGADGEVTLRNITAANLEVRSGSSNSIILQGVTVSGELIVRTANQENPVRIESGAGTNVARTSVHSGVILEAKDNGTLGAVKVTSAAVGKDIEMRGSFENIDIEVEAGAEDVKLQLNIDNNATIKLKGDVSNLTLEASENVTIDTSELSEEIKNALTSKTTSTAETAINSLPEVDAITLSHIGAIDAAFGLRNAALKLGNDVSNEVLTKLLAAKNKADELAAAADRAALEIGYASGESTASVTQNVKLPVLGAYRSKISWSSSNSAVISASGVVTRPVSQQDVTVTLTATIQKGTQESTKEFVLTVKAQAPSASVVTVSSVSATETTVTVTLNQNIANISKTELENGAITTTVTLADGNTYKVGIWDEFHEADGITLSVQNITSSGQSFTLTAHSTPYYGEHKYVVILYTGDKGSANYAEAARKSFTFNKTFSTDFTLSSLVLEGAELKQLNALNEPNGKTGFAPNIANYEVTVPYATDSIMVTATANHAGQTLSYGVGIYDEALPVQSGTPFGPIELRADNITTISVEVVAEDSMYMKTYSVFVLREAQPSGGEPVEEGSIQLEYLAHSSFMLTTPEQKILMDPWRPGAFGLPYYALTNEADIDLITITHNHDDHFYAKIAPTVMEDNRVLYGVTPAIIDEDYNLIAPETFNAITEAIYGDVVISTLGMHHFETDHFLRGDLTAGFIYDTADMRMVHLGDAFGPIKEGFTEEEVNELQGDQGIDILALPIGDSNGWSAIDSDVLLKTIVDLNPRVVIPVHPWETKQQFLDAVTNSVYVTDSVYGWEIETKDSTLTISKGDLPTDGTVIWNVSPKIVNFNDFANSGYTHNTATFTFTVPAGASKVEIYQSEDWLGMDWEKSTTVSELNADSTTATVTGLTAGTFYLFKLSITRGDYIVESEPVDVTTDMAPVGDTTSPAMVEANVDGSTLEITFDEALDELSVPAAADFTVTADAATINVAFVSVIGTTVTLTLETAVTEGQTVTLDYTPGISEIRDAAGNASGELQAAAVMNNTTVTPNSTYQEVMIWDIDGKQTIRLRFDYEIVAVDLGLLKNHITIARDGENFVALGGNDTVEIEYNELIIILEYPLTEDGAVVNVEAGALEGISGNAIPEIVTQPIQLPAEG